MSNVIFQGFGRVENRLKILPEKLNNHISNKMNDVVALTHEASVPLAPVDTGRLRETSKGTVGGRVISHGGKDGQVAQVASGRMTGRTLRGVISYNTDYALEQHENLQYHHPRGGQAKYLEEPAVARRGDNMRLLAEAAVDAVKEVF